MGLVGDHELVRVAGQRADVTCEPRVGLDRQRVAAQRFLARLDRRREALAVALGLQLAVELRDEQPPVREDQHAERASRLDEACGGDRLAGGGRVPEAVAPLRAGILLGRELGLRLFLFVGALELELLVLFLVHLREAVAVPVQLGRLLVRGDQLGQHPGERVDLVPAQLGAGREARRLVGQDALEAEHQPVAHLPVGRRRRASGLHLRERVVERAAAGGSRCERLVGVLARVQEGLARPGIGALDVGG